MQQSAVEELSEEIGRVQSQITRSQEELRETCSDNHRLLRRNTELEAIVERMDTSITAGYSSLCADG